MSKKRPSATSRPAPFPITAAVSKYDSRYWLSRVFKNTYTVSGRRRQTRNWCVKIQHRGTRRTLSLLASDRDQAAAEACRLYQTVRIAGWDQVPGPRQPPAGSREALGERSRERLLPGYWAQRLVRREYTMKNLTGTDRELSARIEFQGAGYYFPLGTAARDQAAAQALRIYRTVTGEGWEAANLSFSRELTVAFRWLERPLAWTYTTIHTQVHPPPKPPTSASREHGHRRSVAVIEPDAGIRRTLAWCVNHMDGFICAATFASAAEALREIRRNPVRVALVSSQLADEPVALRLRELKVAAPVLYSVYEDSEELFRSTPGGATNYLLQRTPPTRFLDPLAAVASAGKLSETQITAAVWQYFKSVFTSPPAGGFARPATNLTQREHDVLARLSKGSPDKDIAERLGISIHTVHEHVRNIFEKLGVHNRTEAVVKFLQK